MTNLGMLADKYMEGEFHMLTETRMRLWIIWAHLSMVRWVNSLFLDLQNVCLFVPILLTGLLLKMYIHSVAPCRIALPQALWIVSVISHKTWNLAQDFLKSSLLGNIMLWWRPYSYCQRITPPKYSFKTLLSWILSLLPARSLTVRACAIACRTPNPTTSLNYFSSPTEFAKKTWKIYSYIPSDNVL